MNIISPPNEKIILLLKYYKDGKIDLAEKRALLISKQFPKHEFAWRVLGAIFQKKGRKEDALNANRKALSLSPNDPEILNNLGVTLQHLGRFEESISSYNQAIELNPGFADAYCNLGLTYEILRQWPEAVENYDNTLKMGSNDIKNSDVVNFARLHRDWIVENRL